MAYSDIDEVLDATGLAKQIIIDLSSRHSTTADVDALIESFIAKADRRINRLCKVPTTVRKEAHEFRRNWTVDLGPYEDEFEFFSAFDPADCVEKVYAIYTAGGRTKLPYPRNCNDLTDSISHIDDSQIDVTVALENSDFKCGTGSIKATFMAASFFTIFKEAGDIYFDKIIYPWSYIGFWFKSNNVSRTFTIRLWDKDGNFAYHTFQVRLANHWEIIALEMFHFIDALSWNSIPIQYITIHADGACEILFDNFCFNDGVFWSYPSGTINWSDPDATPIGRFWVTYSYNEWRTTPPEEVIMASAKLAAVLLLDFMIGLRQQVTGFQQMADTLDRAPDRETLEITRARLRREAEECLISIGYRTYEGMAGS